MKWKLPPNSLFAILLRSRWWVSALVGVGVFGVARLVLPEGLAAFAALPFVVIAIVAGWKQIGTPGPERVAQTLERVRAMTWEAFRREGYEVKRLGGPQLDLELARAGRTTVVGGRRWKAMRTGIEPMREFHAAGVRVLEGVQLARDGSRSSTTNRTRRASLVAGVAVRRSKRIVRTRVPRSIPLPPVPAHDDHH
jgi:restriction system protein